MPEKSGLDILKELRTDYPVLPILILSMHPEDRYAVRSLKAGAAGYINKASVAGELVKAIRQIVEEKRRFISPAVAEQLAQQVDATSEKPDYHRLSDREYQVLCMIASGKKVNEIAKELSLSNRTIHTYRSRLLEKLHLKTDVDITHYAIKNELIDG